jgi:hypothetical protein
MATEPRDCSGRELAERLQIPARNLHTQPGEWAKLGFITRTGFAIYALNTPTGPESSTRAPDPLTPRHCVARDGLRPLLTVIFLG